MEPLDDHPSETEAGPAPESLLPPSVIAPTPRRPRVRGPVKVLVVILSIAAAFTLGLDIGFRGAIELSLVPPPSLAVPASLPPEFATYLEAWQVLQDDYVDPSALDPRALVYGSINGMVDAVGDTGHTRFLTPAQVANERTSLSGSVVGIGTIMGVDDSGALVIQSVIPGGPADHAGLRPRDHVLAVDGKPTAGQDIDSVVTEVRGQVGTVVRLTLSREGVTTPIEVSITRAQIVVPAVSWAMVPGTQIADLRLEEFSKDAAKELATAIAAAQEAGARGLVLDLRSDPGGLVDEATDTISLFLGSGNAYQQRDRAGKVTSIPVKTGMVATSLPLAILVDGGTASASEIVTGALQDADRAVVVGQTTFGTGTVLGQYNLADGSALLVGNLEWLTRDGRQIWRHGLDPDVALPDGAVAHITTPAELGKLDAAGFARAGDAALSLALKSLVGSSPSSAP